MFFGDVSPNKRTIGEGGGVNTLYIQSSVCVCVAPLST